MKPKQHMRIPFTRSASQSAILLALTSALFLLFTADASSWSVEGSESAPRFGHSSSDLQFTDESDLVFERGDSAAPGAGGIILNAGSDDNQDGDLDDDRDNDKAGPTRTPRPSQSPTIDDDPYTGCDDDRDGDFDDDCGPDDKVGPTRTPRPSQSPTIDKDDDRVRPTRTPQPSQSPTIDHDDDEDDDDVDDDDDDDVDDNDDDEDDEDDDDEGDDD